MYQWTIFAIVSLLLLAISWNSLRHPRSHGFYRFFAWEAILALFLVNVEKWFYPAFFMESDRRLVFVDCLSCAPGPGDSGTALTRKTSPGAAGRRIPAGV